MKTVSKKQSRKNAILYKIKQRLPKYCHFCGMRGTDLAHIIPRSLFSEYMCEAWNLVIACRNCHNEYDGDRSYRRMQTKLFKQAYENVKDEDKGRVMRYFDIWTDK